MNYDLSDWVSNLLFTCKYNYSPGGVIEEEKDYAGDFEGMKNSFGNFTELNDPYNNQKMELIENNSQLSENQSMNHYANNNQNKFPETDLEIENLE